MREKLAAIKLVLEGLNKQIDDQNARKMLRVMLMGLTGLQLLLQYGM